MHQLLWKEWHEQNWKLGFGCLVLGAMAFIDLHSRMMTDQIMMMWICLLGIMLLPVLSSTGLIPAERSEGSFETLLAMPIEPWKILLAKTIMGLCLCIVPMLLTGTISILVTMGREAPIDTAINLYIHSMLVIVSLFIWMLALTSHLPSEARAGLVALGVLIMWLIATVGFSSAGLSHWFCDLSPFAFVYGISPEANITNSLVRPLLFEIVILTPLWFWTAGVFDHPSKAD